MIRDGVYGDLAEVVISSKVPAVQCILRGRNREDNVFELDRERLHLLQVVYASLVLTSFCGITAIDVAASHTFNC